MQARLPEDVRHTRVLVLGYLSLSVVGTPDNASNSERLFVS